MKILRRRKKGEVKPACGRRPTSVYGSPPLPTYSASWFALEPRIMFDGAGVATLGTVATEPLAQSQAEASLSADDATSSDTPPAAAPTGEPQFNSNDQALFDALAAYDTSAARQEIVFLSPSVRDYQQLLDGISPNVEVIILDPARDGVQQMAEVLVGRTGIDAIHLIGEGTFTVAPFIPPPGGGGGGSGGGGGGGGTGGSGGTGSGSGSRSGGSGGIVPPPIQQPPVLIALGVPVKEASVVGATNDPLPRTMTPNRTFARVEQPTVGIQEPPARPAEPFSLPVKKVLAVGHKLVERLTRLAEDLERGVQE